jgi:hypothetical protein
MEERGGRAHPNIVGEVLRGRRDRSQLLLRDVSFDALCNEYGKVIKLLDAFEAHVKQLKARRAWLEEELLTRTEGHQPH